MDQLSENYLSTSPYAYVMNNPVMHNDPDGRLTQFAMANDAESPDQHSGLPTAYMHTGAGGGSVMWNSLSNWGNGENYSLSGESASMAFSYLASGGSFSNLSTSLSYGYLPLTKEIYSQYILVKGRGQLSGSDENFLGHKFEKVFIQWAQENIGMNVKDNTIGKNYYGAVPDATSPLMYDGKYAVDGVFYEVKNTFRNIGIATAQIKREIMPCQLIIYLRVYQEVLWLLLLLLEFF